MYSVKNRLALPIGLVLVATMFAPLMAAPAAAEGIAVDGFEVIPRPAQDYMRFIQVNNFRFDPLAETPDIPSPLSYDGKSVAEILSLIHISEPTRPY